MSRLSRQCGIFNISQTYRPPWPVTGIALRYFIKNVWGAPGSLVVKALMLQAEGHGLETR
jgi:hypothetical protein